MARTGHRPQGLDLADGGDRALLVARDHQHVGLQRLDLGQRHRHVVQLGRQLIVDHDLHAVALHVVEHAGAHVLGERIVLHGECNE